MTNYGASDGAKKPDFPTVEEAAAVVRIGRTTAYQLARQWLTTGGAHGLPVVRLGKLLRVPRVEVERLLGGPITWPPAGDEPAASATIGETDFAVAYEMLGVDVSGDPADRTAADNQTVRNVFVIGPDKKIKLSLVYR